MSPRYLLDTNVLVYAVDPRDPAKRGRARAAIRQAVASRNAALPSQVLPEYANVLGPSPDLGAVGREVERLLLTFLNTVAYSSLRSQADEAQEAL